MTCAPSEVSDQPGHPPSLIRVFFCRLHEEAFGPWLHNVCTAKALIRCQSDLSLSWAHKSFCWFCHAAVQLFKYNVLQSSTYITPSAHKDKMTTFS